jgi:hypothetical protein
LQDVLRRDSRLLDQGWFWFGSTCLVFLALAYIALRMSI